MIAEELLAASPTWGALPPRARHELARRGVECRWATGEVIFRAGDRALGIHLLLDGRVRVVRESGTRRQLVHVDETGRQHEAFGIHDALAGLCGQLADLGDAVAFDAKRALSRGASRAVDDRCVHDQRRRAVRNGGGAGERCDERRAGDD